MERTYIANVKAGEKCRICGFVENLRNKRTMAFLVIKDITGKLQVTVKSITTAKEQKLYLDVADAKEMKGKRILIVDDVISTGKSLNALEQLVEQVGGIICGKMTVLAEGDAADRKDIIYLEKLPLFDKNGNPLN